MTRPIFRAMGIFGAAMWGAVAATHAGATPWAIGIILILAVSAYFSSREPER